VLFDGAPAEMFHVAPDQVICVVPPDVVNKTSVTVQVVSAGQAFAPFIVFVGDDIAGLLTRSFPDLPPHGSVDGYILNADGTQNDTDHPAAPGSTVTLFATGVAPGPVPLLWNAPAQERGDYEFTQYVSGTAHKAPSFIDAVYAIDFQIPDQPGPGVYAVPVPGVLTRFEIGRVGSGVGVYVK